MTAPYLELAAIADSTAITLGAATLITDSQYNVLTYSRRRGPAGTIWERAVLARTLPREGVRAIERISATDWNTQGPRAVVVDGHPHRVSRIDAGPGTLGYLWATLSSPAGPRPLHHAHPTDADAILTDGAARVREMMLRLRLESRTDTHHDRGALLGALRGNDVDVDAFTSRLGHREHRLLVLDTTHPVALSALETRTIETITALEIEAARQGLVAVQGSRVYALMTDAGSSAIARKGEQVASRIAACLDIETKGVFTAPVSDLHKLPALLAYAERRLVEPVGQDGPRVRELADATSTVTLDALTEVFARNPERLHPGLHRLVDVDHARHTSHIDTLHTYFECNCDLAEASRALFIHRNTLKYRLSRIREISGLDLDQPSERLLIELQVRFVRDRIARTAAGRTRVAAHFSDIA